MYIQTGQQKIGLAVRIIMQMRETKLCIKTCCIKQTGTQTRFQEVMRRGRIWVLVTVLQALAAAPQVVLQAALQVLPLIRVALLHLRALQVALPPVHLVVRVVKSRTLQAMVTPTADLPDQIPMETDGDGKTHTPVSFTVQPLILVQVAIRIVKLALIS